MVNCRRGTAANDESEQRITLVFVGVQELTAADVEGGGS